MQTQRSSPHLLPMCCGWVKALGEPRLRCVVAARAGGLVAYSDASGDSDGSGDEAEDHSNGPRIVSFF